MCLATVRYCCAHYPRAVQLRSARLELKLFVGQVPSMCGCSSNTEKAVYSLDTQQFMLQSLDHGPRMATRPVGGTEHTCGRFYVSTGLKHDTAANNDQSLLYDKLLWYTTGHPISKAPPREI